MQINVKATKLELTEQVKNYVLKKIGALEKYLGKIVVTNCGFEVSKEIGGQKRGEIYKAELNLEIPGELINVQKTGKDVITAIDDVKNHAVRLIVEHKEKKIAKKMKEIVKDI